MFRFEIWINKSAPAEQREELKNFLKEKMGCPSIEEKSIS